MNKFISIVAAALALATPIVANAGTPRDLSDLVGIRASSLDGVMGDRGYRYIRSRGLIQYWWNGNSNACVSALTSNGRISRIQTALARDCGQASGRPSGGGTSAGNGLGGLVGMDAIKAIDEMTNRGFRNVDTISTPNALYGVYFNPRTRVCAQLTTENQKVLSVDVMSNPKCR